MTVTIIKTPKVPNSEILREKCCPNLEYQNWRYFKSHNRLFYVQTTFKRTLVPWQKRLVLRIEALQSLHSHRPGFWNPKSTVSIKWSFHSPTVLSNVPITQHFHSNSCGGTGMKRTVKNATSARVGRKGIWPTFNTTRAAKEGLMI